MNIKPDLWDALVDAVGPSTHRDGEITHVSITPTNGGVLAKTLRTESEEDEVPDSPFETLGGEAVENEEVFLYEAVGQKLKQRVYSTIDEVLVNTSAFSETVINYVTAEEEDLTVVFSIRINFVDGHVTEAFEGAAEEADGFIDSTGEFAYGEISSVSYNEDRESWSTDGTLYEYTDAPYEMWGNLSSMEEWIAFAADTEAEAEQIRRRSRHVNHTHPTKEGLLENHPIVQWYKSVEEEVEDMIEVDDTVASEAGLRRVQMDEVSSVAEYTVVV